MHVIDSLEQNGITDIILIVGYKKERIMDYFEDGLNFGVKIKYVEQNAQLGTAHGDTLYLGIKPIYEVEDKTMQIGRASCRERV